jgi:GNAT superfamily N-acetyltransferase
MKRGSSEKAGHPIFPMYPIRRSTDADTPALARIFLAARVQAFHWLDPDSFGISDFAAKTEGETIYLAEGGNGCPVGFISVWRLESFVHHLYVDPGHQWQGIGSRLLHSLESWLPRPYQLKCLVANQPARAFYRKHGWTEQGRGSDELGDYVVMEYDG